MDLGDDPADGHTPVGQNFPNTQDLGGPLRPSARARSGSLFSSAPLSAPPAEADAELNDDEADALLFAQCDHGDQLLTQVSGAQFGAALSSLLLATAPMSCFPSASSSARCR